MIRLVPELPCHVGARERLLDAAFGSARFSKTCERLRENRRPAANLAFAAMDGTRLVGTLRLWPLEVGSGNSALLLGPLAVSATHRHRGIGGQLIEHALSAAERDGHRAVVLLGDASYYGRFGFSARLARELWLPGPYEQERLLGLELRPGGLEGAAGLVRGSGEWTPALQAAA